MLCSAQFKTFLKKEKKNANKTMTTLVAMQTSNVAGSFGHHDTGWLSVKKALCEKCISEREMCLLAKHGGSCL
jgi:hypothetical protein